MDSVSGFGFRQNTMYRWKQCLGDCIADYGFEGGVRELALLHRYVPAEDARRGKNMIFTYSNEFKAYFRFQDLHNKFEKDEFVDWTWKSFKNKPEHREDYIGVDIIPNDVCPSLFRQSRLLTLDGSVKVDTIDLESELN